jgi:uncharacterized protein
LAGQSDGKGDRAKATPEEQAAFLERVRRSGIKVDRQGRFWHEGAEVKHLGLKQALFRWLDRLPPPEDRYVLRLDAQRFAYLEVEDTPLVATSMRWSGQQALLGLQDGSEETLDPETLTVDAAGILRCRVRAGRIEVRLDTAAAAVLAERIEDGVLRAAGGEVVLR